MTVGLASSTQHVEALELRFDAWILEGMDDFAALYEEMLPNVYRYATARLGVLVGEEVCSDVFHAAAKALREGRGAEVTPAWLMTVARNKVIDQWRRQERRQKITHLVSVRRVDLIEPSAEDEASKQWTDVMHALDQLPERYRTLLTLRYLDDLTVAELARVSGQSESATESALARARTAFRTLFAEAT